MILYLYSIWHTYAMKKHTYVTTVYGFRIEYRVTKLKRWLFLVFFFMATFHEATERPAENLAVFYTTIIHEPSAPVSVQIFAIFLSYLYALDVPNFLSNENYLYVDPYMEYLNIITFKRKRRITPNYLKEGFRGFRW